MLIKNKGPSIRNIIVCLFDQLRKLSHNCHKIKPAVVGYFEIILAPAAGYMVSFGVS